MSDISYCPFCCKDLSEFPEVMLIEPYRSEEYLIAKLNKGHFLGSDNGYVVRCIVCGGQSPIGMTKEEAKKKWNLRGNKNPVWDLIPNYEDKEG